MSETINKGPIFHVGYSEITGVIYAGTINKKGTKWLKQTDVTQEALTAVRDHFMNIYYNQKEQAGIVGYRWKTKSGKTVTLQLNIIDAQEGNDSIE